MSIRSLHALHAYEENGGGPPGRVHPQSVILSVPHSRSILISELFAVTKAWCPLEPSVLWKKTEIITSIQWMRSIHIYQFGRVL